MKALISCFILFYISSAFPNERPQKAIVEHVVFIGIDGYGRNNFKSRPLRKASQARIPHIKSIKNSGAWTLKAKIDSRSFSGPNWMGMLTGSPSFIHGVKTNNCERGKGMTTIFEVIREQRPEAEIGAVYEWDSIGCYPLEGSLSFKSSHTGKGTMELAETAASYILEKRPLFLLTYFGAADNAGHGHKANGPEYNKAVEDIDRGIGKILGALKEAGLLDKTLVILTSDHGQMRFIRGHTWSFTPVPFFFMGPKVLKGQMKRGFGKMRIKNNMVAPLVAFALGLEPSSEWKSTVEPLKKYFKK